MVPRGGHASVAAEGEGWAGSRPGERDVDDHGSGVGTLVLFVAATAAWWPSLCSWRGRPCGRRGEDGAALQQLSPDVPSALKVLSCCGSHFDVVVLEAVKNNDGGSGTALLPGLTTAGHEGLVETAGPAFAFSRDLLQRATFDSPKGGTTGRARYGRGQGGGGGLGGEPPGGT